MAKQFISVHWQEPETRNAQLIFTGDERYKGLQHFILAPREVKFIYCFIFTDEFCD